MTKFEEKCELLISELKESVEIEKKLLNSENTKFYFGIDQLVVSVFKTLDAEEKIRFLTKVKNYEI